MDTDMISTAKLKYFDIGTSRMIDIVSSSVWRNVVHAASQQVYLS
jgi:hypothetical protein